MKTTYPFTVAFKIAREKTHTVEVVAWSCKGINSEDVWHWNVYAYVYNTHPLFSQPEFLQSNLPLHYGPTLEERHVITPVLGIKYDWQKEARTLKFGSDYSHYTDPEDHPSPIHGIPNNIEQDALELAEWLAARKES